MDPIRPPEMTAKQAAAAPLIAAFAADPERTLRAVKEHKATIAPRATDHELMTTAEVAEAFRVGASAVSRWAKEGLLSSFRTPGGRLRFYADEIRALQRGETWTGGAR